MWWMLWWMYSKFKMKAAERSQLKSFCLFNVDFEDISQQSHPVFTYSKSAMETPEQCVRSVES